jgi:hypothetical protein
MNVSGVGLCALASIVFASGNACSSASDVADSSATSEGSVARSTQLGFTRLLSAVTSGFTEPSNLVVRDAGALASAWRTIYDGIPGNPPPAIDLTQRMVVVLAQGPKNTGGFSIAVDSVTLDPSSVTVRYTATSPGPGCVTTQMTTSPIDVVSVPRSDLLVRFESRTVIQKC